MTVSYPAPKPQTRAQPQPRTPTDVQAVGHDCDLALLSVEDEAFWTSPTAMLPLELGPLPTLQQAVVVVG